MSYPSHGIPGGIQVCAKNLEGGEIICTDDRVYDKDRYVYRTGYFLDLPVGDYEVFESDNGVNPLFGDYYYENDAGEPIVVTVEEGITKFDIGPFR